MITIGTEWRKRGAIAAGTGVVTVIISYAVANAGLVTDPVTGASLSAVHVHQLCGSVLWQVAAAASATAT